MILRTLLALLVAIVLFYGYYKYSKAPRSQRKKILIQWGSSLLVVALLLLVAFGRMHWIGAVFAALFPILIRAFPFLLKNYQRKSTSNVKPGNTSQVKTHYLILTLDHDSGEIAGEVIDGLFKTRTLASLSLDEIKQLLNYYRTNDNESFRLLTAYVQRTYPDESFEAGGEQQEATSSPSDMNKREALAVLGLADGASKEKIIAAHKTLIQRLHPDRGGSNYLAAKVNEAKDLLLKDL